MAQLFRDLSSLGNSKREPRSPSTTTTTTIPKASSTAIVAADLSSPFGDLSSDLSDSDLRSTAHEIFSAACRTSAGKPISGSPVESPVISTTVAQQRSIGSAAASKMKKALGLRKSSGSGKAGRRVLTVGEVMREQLGVSEAVDSRVRRALLRISAGQVMKLEIAQLGISC